MLHGVTIQNKVLRIVVNAPWYVSNFLIHRDLEVLRVQEFVREVAAKAFYKADVPENPLIRSIGNYDGEKLVSIKGPR